MTRSTKPSWKIACVKRFSRKGCRNGFFSTTANSLKPNGLVANAKARLLLAQATRMERACAVLGIKLIFTAPYSPESKGKIERFNRTIGSFLAEADLKNAKDLSEFNGLFNVWLAECYHNKEHSGINAAPETAYKSSKAPLRFVPAETVANAFLRLEQRKVDKSGCISFMGRKYEAGSVYIGRTVNVVYDPADMSTLTIEDTHFNTSFRISELMIGEHTGPRPKLPDFMTYTKPLTSRLLDEKQKQYEKRQLSAKRAISYAQINKVESGAANV